MISTVRENITEFGLLKLAMRREIIGRSEEHREKTATRILCENLTCVCIWICSCKSLSEHMYVDNVCNATEQCN